MLKLIDRYLIKSFFMPMFYCMLAFIVLYIAYDLSDHMEDFFDKGIPTKQIIKYYIYNVPIIVSQAAPFATLLALLYCLGNLSRNNEIIAMRASGIALMRIVRPYLIIGFIMYIVVLVVSEICVPISKRLVAEIVPVTSSVQDALGSKSSFNAFTFYNSHSDREWVVGKLDLELNLLEHVKITQFTHSKDHRVSKMFEAEKAEYIEDYGWWFYNATEIQFSPDGEAYPADKFKKRYVRHFKETPQSIASMQYTSPEMMTFSEILYCRKHLNKTSDFYKKLKMETNRRIATPLACFVFVLLAAPFGIFHTRAGMIKGVITSILLCLVYYLIAALFISLGEKGADSPQIGFYFPIIAAWLPNISFIGIGFYLLHRMR